MSKKHEEEFSVFERVGERIDRLPEWLKPVVFGPLFLLLLIFARVGRRSGLVFFMIVLSIGLIRSQRPFHDLGIGVGVLGLLIAASALGGLVYSLAGRWIKRVPIVGPYVAGMLSVLPYVLACIPVIRLADGAPMWVRFQDVDIFVSVLCTVLFGGLIGYIFFRPGALD